MIEKISAVTLRVASMRASVRFYKDVLGLETIYGSEGSYFTFLMLTVSGRTSWKRAFDPDSPQDASWGERYFHLPDPDGYELSFARPI